MVHDGSRGCVGVASVATNEWPEVRAWRRAMRPALIAARIRMPRSEREKRTAAILAHLGTQLARLDVGVVGFYWAFKGEVDVRGIVRTCLDRGGRAGLPVVVQAGMPLEFWNWYPRMKMSRGVWNIPVPAERALVKPSLLLVPLVGFDTAGYRLGYGGGYYDRTLAAMSPRPVTIGVGFELGRLSTICPQAHDIPMDAIVTEEGFRWVAGSPEHRWTG